MKLIGVSALTALLACSALVEGKKKGVINYGANPFDMIFGELPESGPSFFLDTFGNQRGAEQSRMSPPSNDIFLTKSSQKSNNDLPQFLIMPSPSENEVEDTYANTGDKQSGLFQSMSEFAPVVTQASPEPAPLTTTLELEPQFSVVPLQEFFEEKSGGLSNPRQMNLELEFQFDMPRPGDEKTNKVPLKDDIIIPASTSKPEPAAEEVRESSSGEPKKLTLLDLLFPPPSKKLASSSPDAQELTKKSPRCDEVTCLPTPKESNCELMKTPIEIKSNNDDFKFEELSDCCPLWFCTRPDGTFHTHYGMIGKVEKKAGAASSPMEIDFPSKQLSNKDHKRSSSKLDSFKEFKITKSIPSPFLSAPMVPFDLILKDLLEPSTFSASPYGSFARNAPADGNTFMAFNPAKSPFEEQAFGNPGGKNSWSFSSSGPASSSRYYVTSVKRTTTHFGKPAEGSTQFTGGSVPSSKYDKLPLFPSRIF